MVEKQLQPNYTNQRYDSKTNTIVQEFQSGLTQWLDPKTKKVLHEKNIYTNEETFYEYDDNGNLIHYKSSDAPEKWYQYDDNGKLTGCKCGNNPWDYFDEDGNFL